jgi:hypothetical protein
MEEFLISPIFRYLIFPLGTAVLGVAVKYVTRNDQYAKFRKEDVAVGLDLILTAVLMLLVLTTDRAVALVSTNQELSRVLSHKPIDASAASVLQGKALALSQQQTTSIVLILLMFLSLWSISTIVRKWGWQSETEMKPVIGIAIPLALGILSLILVMAEAAQ